MKVARVPSQISRLRLIVTGPFAAFARCYTRALCPGADPNTRADYCRIDLGTGDDYFSMSPPPRVAVLVVQTRCTFFLLFRSDFPKKKKIERKSLSVFKVSRESWIRTCTRRCVQYGWLATRLPTRGGAAHCRCRWYFYNLYVQHTIYIIYNKY